MLTPSSTAPDSESQEQRSEVASEASTILIEASRPRAHGHTTSNQVLSTYMKYFEYIARALGCRSDARGDGIDGGEA